MYKHNSIPNQQTGAQVAAIKPVRRYGVSVYVDTDADWIGPDFLIDPADEKGLKIFREFASKMAEHYKSLLYENIPSNPVNYTRQPHDQYKFDDPGCE